MTDPLQLGRYTLFAQIASGGMATVYLGRMNGELGFGRTVAIKRMHPHTSQEPEFVSMFLDEAHLAARVQHPNVVTTLDVVNSDGELFLVMEYVQGASLASLIRATLEADTKVPVPIAVSIAVGYLAGLHAAHEARDEQGRPLGIVHRDVSPQNVLVGVDGVARLLDFGVARASLRLAATRDGQLKGKMRYMAPEQLAGEASRQTDVYAGGIVLWETLTGRRAVRGDNEAQILSAVARAEFSPPSDFNLDVTQELDRIIAKAVAREPPDRWPTAQDMALALDAALRPASNLAVAEWVQRTAGAALQEKAALVAVAESGTDPRGAIAEMRASGRLPQLSGSETGSNPSQSSVGARSRQSGSTGMGLSRPSQEDIATTTQPGASAGKGGWRVATYAGIGAAVLSAGVALGLVARRPAHPEPAVASPREPAHAVVAPSASLSAAATPDDPTGAPEPGAALDASSAASGVPAAPVVDQPDNPAKGSAPVASTHAASTTTPKPRSSSDLKHLLDTR